MVTTVVTVAAMAAEIARAMADSFGGKARLLLRGAGPLLVLVLASSCGGSNSGVASGKSAQQSTTTIAGAVPVVSDVSTTTVAVAPPDGAAALQAAFDQIAAGYHFATTATVNGAVAITAQGDRVADGTRMSVASNGASVDYVVTPGGTWVNKDGTWSEITDTTPPSDPIGVLRAPASVTVTSFGAGAPTVLTASYPAAALSLPGDAPVNVTFTINGTTLASLGYTTTTDGGAADVHTDITALVDSSPVTLPQV
jgi:hypothetical protein